MLWQSVAPGAGAVTPEFLAVVAAALVSLIGSYWPAARAWMDARSGDEKRAVMLALTALVAVIVYALSCAGILTDLLGVTLACDQVGALQLLKVFFYAAVANQVAFSFTPKKISANA